MEKEEVITIRNISKKYGDIPALDNISLGIPKNSIFGLLGSNGAGKSTLLHILIGLLNYDAGQIYFFGERVKHHSKALKKRVALVPQKISLYENLSIYDNLYFFAKAYKLKRREIIARIKYLSFVLKLGDLEKKIRYLSGGYQRRVSLAVALVADPEIIILDEALVGIDLNTKKIIIDMLSDLKKEKTIIITTHAIKEIEEVCDYVCFLHKGKKILDGETKEVIKKYCSNIRIKITIRFKEEEIAKKAAENYGLSNSVKYDKNFVYLESFSGDYYAMILINFLKKNERYGDYIEGVEINKPSLEEIVFRMIEKN